TEEKKKKIKSTHEKTKEQKNNKKTDKSSTESGLTIEHYSDFDKKENHTKSKETIKEEKPKKKKQDRQPKKEKKEKVKKDKKPYKFKKIHANIIGLLILLLILITILWYVFSSASDVKEIKYNGNSLVSEEELEERIGFGLGSKMFSISLNDAEENIELLPVIKDVTASRDWPNGVTLDVNEYKAVA